MKHLHMIYILSLIMRELQVGDITKPILETEMINNGMNLMIKMLGIKFIFIMKKDKSQKLT